jgi:hypothetical protein
MVCDVAKKCKSAATLNSCGMTAVINENFMHWVVKKKKKRYT